MNWSKFRRTWKASTGVWIFHDRQQKKIFKFKKENIYEKNNNINATLITYMPVRKIPKISTVKALAQYQNCDLSSLFSKFWLEKLYSVSSVSEIVIWLLLYLVFQIEINLVCTTFKSYPDLLTNQPIMTFSLLSTNKEFKF